MASKLIESQRRTGDRLNNVEYDYEEVWGYVTNVDGWKPQVPAHTMEMKTAHMARLLELPWVQPTSSADKNAVLGLTAGWVEGDMFEYDGKTFDPANKTFAPEIPSQKIFGYLLTDSTLSPDNKKKVILVSGTHPHEHMGDWVLEGLVNFLAGGDPKAEKIRQHYEFYVYPCLNPDGKVLHTFDLEPRCAKYTYDKYAGNPELYKAGEPNHNRVWNNSGFTTIDILSAAIKADTGGKADYAWDFHGGCPHDPGDWRATSQGMNSAYAVALKKRGLPTCKPKTKDIDAGRFRHWIAKEVGVPYSFTHEPSKHYDRKLTAEAGRTIGLAFYDILH